MPKTTDTEKLFVNVIALSELLQRELQGRRPETQQELYRWFVDWQVRIQLGQLQQLTMISQNLKRLAEDIFNMAAQVARESQK